jgi:DNA-binding transcriptional LysR family regulator
VVVPSGGKQFNTYQELVLLIKKSPFIFFNKEFAPQYNDKLLEICERMGFRPDITHEANNVHSILQLVEAGLGVSILPASLKQQYAYLHVSFIELENIPVNTEVVLAYKPSNKSAALKWFIEKYNTQVV